jgi:hypothetical protein
MADASNVRHDTIVVPETMSSAQVYARVGQPHRDGKDDGRQCDEQ